MRRIVAAAVAVAVLVGSGASCTRDGEGASPSTTVRVGDETPREGGTFTIGVGELETLDPAQARSVDEMMIADQLFDSLAAYHPETLEPLPSLAGEWRASEDQRQWDFVLRPDAVFGNGRAITADDVKYSLERIARRDSGSPVADLLEPVTGFRAFAVDASADALAGIAVTAPNTVHIALDEPLSTLPALLASPAFGIVPREAVEAQDRPFAERPVGSGPLAFEGDVDEGDRLTLVPAAGRDLYVERVHVLRFDSSRDAYDAFTEGEVDVVAQVPPERVADAASRFGRDLFAPYVAELFYGLNLRNPKFSDARFREAIVRAIDTEAILADVYRGTALPLDAVVVKGLAAHQEDACGDACEHDPDRARDLVDDVFPDGNVPEVHIDFDEDATQQAVAEAMRDDLQAVGIPATLRAKPLAEYQEFAVSGQQELFRLGWIGAYPSADAFLPPLFLTGSASNLTGFSDAAVDESLRAARRTADASARVEHFRSAERTVLAQHPVVLIAQFELHPVAAPHVRGFEVTSFGTFDVTSLWLARSG